MEIAEDRNDEFYIGWQPKAPGSFVLPSVIFISIVLSGAFLLAITIGYGQKKFSNAQFEFHKFTEVKGIYQSSPLPMLQVNASRDVYGNLTTVTIPLVGYGKSGTEGLFTELEIEHGADFDGRELILKGYLIYGDGKCFLQVDRHDDPLIYIGEKKAGPVSVRQQAREVFLEGEILDPKCYFGVMKPGLGKVHKDCAARCIAGGINPVFVSIDGNGSLQYSLLLGPGGERINQHVNDLIGEPVRIKAKVATMNEWQVLLCDPFEISRTGRKSFFTWADESCKPDRGLQNQ